MGWDILLPPQPHRHGAEGVPQTPPGTSPQLPPRMRFREASILLMLFSSSTQSWKQSRASGSSPKKGSPSSWLGWGHSARATSTKQGSAHLLVQLLPQGPLEQRHQEVVEPAEGHRTGGSSARPQPPQHPHPHPRLPRDGSRAPSVTSVPGETPGAGRCRGHHSRQPTRRGGRPRPRSAPAAPPRPGRPREAEPRRCPGWGTRGG